MVSLTLTPFVLVAHDDQLRQLLVRVHGDLQGEQLVGVRPGVERVLGHAVGAGVLVAGHGDGEERADVRVLRDGQREDGRGELRRVVVDVQHLDAALDEPRAQAHALDHVGDGHLELQEALVALEQVAAVPQRLAVDGDLRGVDVAGLAVHPQVRRAHLQLVQVSRVRQALVRRQAADQRVGRLLLGDPVQDVGGRGAAGSQQDRRQDQHLPAQRHDSARQHRSARDNKHTASASVTRPAALPENLLEQVQIYVERLHGRSWDPSPGH
uniref:Uncharacterized protein n=1 Tax=Myripristis murdjan TaxID=586833 RepID=A0A667Z8Q3_9TELE